MLQEPSENIPISRLMSKVYIISVSHAIQHTFSSCFTVALAQDSDIKQHGNVEQATELSSLNFLSTLPNLISYTLFLEEGAILPTAYFASIMKALSQLVHLKQLNLIFDFLGAHAASFDIPIGISVLSLGRPSSDAIMHLSPQISSVNVLRILVRQLYLMGYDFKFI